MLRTLSSNNSHVGDTTCLATNIVGDRARYPEMGPIPQVGTDGKQGKRGSKHLRKVGNLFWSFWC
jgi:hypothetical protein